MRKNTVSITRYLDILSLRRDGKTFEEIGEKLGISRQRVWQIHQRAVKRIENTTSVGNRHARHKQAA